MQEELLNPSSSPGQDRAVENESNNTCVERASPYYIIHEEEELLGPSTSVTEQNRAVENEPDNYFVQPSSPHNSYQELENTNGDESMKVSYRF